MRLFRRPLIWSLLLVMGISFAKVVAQDQPFSFTTSPLPISLSANPGQTISTELRIKNNSTQTEHLKVSLFKFSVNENSEIKLSEKQPTDDFLNWATFDPTTFDASPGEWKSVKMTIAVPNTAAFGYYYAVGFSRANAPKVQPGASTLQGQIITFVLLDVKAPGAKRELKVDSLNSDHHVYEFLPTTFTIKVKNTGNVHIAPAGDLFITRGKKTIATLSLNPNQGNVLPNSTRKFQVAWEDGFPVYVAKQEDNKTIKQLKWDFSKLPSLRIGKYTAHLVLVYDDGNRDIPVEAQLSFWVIPWRLIIGIVIILVLPPLAVYLIMRLIYKKKLQNLRSTRHETTPKNND